MMMRAKHAHTHTECIITRSIDQARSRGFRRSNHVPESFHPPLIIPIPIAGCVCSEGAHDGRRFVRWRQQGTTTTTKSDGPSRRRKSRRRRPGLDNECFERDNYKGKAPLQQQPPRNNKQPSWSSRRRRHRSWLARSEGELARDRSDRPRLLAAATRPMRRFYPVCWLFVACNRFPLLAVVILSYIDFNSTNQFATSTALYTYMHPSLTPSRPAAPPPHFPGRRRRRRSRHQATPRGPARRRDASRSRSCPRAS